MGATKKDRRINAVLSVLLTILCIAWLYPVFMILMNSLKTERAITTSHAFELPNAETFVGLKNYIYGIQEMDFLSSFWYSLVITVSSVALILLCCSMCAWYITRVQNTLSKGMYYLCVFSMIVPFQMVMFTLAKTADTLKLNNPYNICIFYPFIFIYIIKIRRGIFHIINIGIIPYFQHNPTTSLFLMTSFFIKTAIYYLICSYFTKFPCKFQVFYSILTTFFQKVFHIIVN